jgi:hypothetical protein
MAKWVCKVKVRFNEDATEESTMTTGIHVPPAWLAVPQTVEINAEWDRGRAKNLLRLSRDRARVQFNVRERPSNARALDEFLALAKSLESGDTKAIIAFVKKWGALNLCQQHRRPYTHLKKPGEATCRPSNKEPVEVWQRFVNDAQHALITAMRLHKHRPPLLNDRERWELARMEPEERKNELATRADDSGELATKIVREWLKDSGLTLLPQYVYGSGVTLSFEHEGRLFDLLTAQLLMAVAGAAGIGLCAECGRLFRLDRQRKPGQRTFCPRRSCQKGAAAKWVRESRSRARDSKQSSGETSQKTKASKPRKSEGSVNHETAKSR